MNARMSVKIALAIWGLLLSALFSMPTRRTQRLRSQRMVRPERKLCWAAIQVLGQS
jgi:hypothetical protein